MTGYIDNFKTKDQLEKQKEVIFDRYIKDLETLYVNEVVKILTWFRDKFPNHTLGWVDGMGTEMWIINGEIWDDSDVWTVLPRSSWMCKHASMREALPDEWNRKQKMLWPLIEFHSSITNCTYAHQQGIQIGSWKIDRVSREIVNG